MDYTFVPSVIFSHPPVGSCGYSERSVREMVTKNELPGPVTIYETHFRNMFYAVCEEGVKSRSHMKLVCVGKEERVVGLHMMGEGCDEMLQGFGVAMKMGATKDDFDNCTAIHPVGAEELVTLKKPRGDDDNFEYKCGKEQTVDRRYG